MSDDLAEFLRRAAQRYAAAQSEHAEIRDAEVVEDAEILDSGEAVGQDVAAHVARRMATSGFSRRISSLGTNVEQSDDRMEAHLHSAFEHDLGQLGRGTSTPADSILDADDRGAKPEPATVPQAGREVLALLHDDRQLRNAIILSEILRRPEHLW